MNQKLDQLQSALQADLEKLNNHPIYASLKTLEDVRTFMEHHVYAVWDFMSLLKSLQQDLTCINTPWIPGKNATISRFINEIVLGEESDVDPQGNPASHFDLYVHAMAEVGANTHDIQDFLNRVQTHQQVNQAAIEARVPSSVQKFLEFTFRTIDTNEAHRVAAAFTFGREDVIPDMFERLLEGSAEADQVQFPKLVYYLQRHIELDGDEHGPLSLQMISQLCGNDDQKWLEAEQTAKEAIACRLLLWDGVMTALKSPKKVLAEFN